MDIKQALEDWIGDDENTHWGACNNHGDKSNYKCVCGKEDRNKLRASLRASLPSLLAKIEQQRLLDRKDELIDLWNSVDDEGSEAMTKIHARIAQLDALLNTKGADDAKT